MRFTKKNYKTVIDAAHECLTQDEFVDFVRCLGLRESRDQNDRLMANAEIIGYVKRIKEILKRKKAEMDKSRQ